MKNKQTKTHEEYASDCMELKSIWPAIKWFNLSEKQVFRLHSINFMNRASMTDRVFSFENFDRILYDSRAVSLYI